MAIGEGEAAGAVVVIGGHVSPEIMAIEEDEKIAVVNRVRMLVQKDEGARRRRVVDVRLLAIGVKQAVDLGGVPAIAIHVSVHRNAAHAGKFLSANWGRAVVRRTA